MTRAIALALLAWLVLAAAPAGTDLWKAATQCEANEILFVMPECQKILDTANRQMRITRDVLDTTEDLHREIEFVRSVAARLP